MANFPFAPESYFSHFFPFDAIANVFDPFTTQVASVSGNDGSDSKSTSSDRKGFRPLRLDIAEKDNSVIISTDIPGVPLEDVNIEVLDKDLTITVSPKLEETSESKFIHRERYAVAQMKRTVQISRDFDPESVEASLVNGVLTVTVPLKERTKPMSVNISTKPTREIEED